MKNKCIVFWLVFGLQTSWAWALEPVPKNNIYLNSKIVQELAQAYELFESLEAMNVEFQKNNADVLRYLDELDISLHPLTLFYTLKDQETQVSFAHLSDTLEYPLDNIIYSDYLYAMQEQYTLILEQVKKLEKDNSQLIVKIDFIKAQSSELTKLLSLKQVFAEYKNAIYLKKTEQLEFVSKLNSQHAFIQSVQAELLLQNNYPRQSLEISSKLLQDSPKNPRLLYSKALAELMLKQYALAQSDLDLAIQYQDKVAEFWLARGATKQYLQDFSNMCDDYRKACALGLCNALATSERCK